MARRIHILIAEPSVIIRTGVIGVLRKLDSLNIDIAEITDMEQLEAQIGSHSPDILFINPSYLGLFSAQQIRNTTGCTTLKTVALQHSLSDDAALRSYDAVISIYDSARIIREKLLGLVNAGAETKMELTSREQEIIVCIAKGQSNKQIADCLHLSTHTVMTHRRNIAGKLQIHSPAGLTIYAIVNKLVDIGEIKDVMNLKD